MSDIQFPRGQQSITDLQALSQSAQQPPKAEDATPVPVTKDIQAVFVSPRRVVDGNGVQLLFRDTQSGEVLRSFPPEQASGAYQVQQENNNRIAAAAAEAAATTVADAEEAVVEPESAVSQPDVNINASSGGSEAGNLSVAAFTPTSEQATPDVSAPDDSEVSLASA